MCKAINDILKEKDDAIKEKDVAIKAKDVAVKTALLDKCRILQNMMEKLSLTAEEAMDIAGIPEEKRGILSAELEKMTEA